MCSRFHSELGMFQIGVPVNWNTCGTLRVTAEAALDCCDPFLDVLCPCSLCASSKITASHFLRTSLRYFAFCADLFSVAGFPIASRKMSSWIIRYLGSLLIRANRSCG